MNSFKHKAIIIQRRMISHLRNGLPWLCEFHSSFLLLNFLLLSTYLLTYSFCNFTDCVPVFFFKEFFFCFFLRALPPCADYRHICIKLARLSCILDVSTVRLLNVKPPEIDETLYVFSQLSQLFILLFVGQILRGQF